MIVDVFYVNSGDKRALKTMGEVPIKGLNRIQPGQVWGLVRGGRQDTLDLSIKEQHGNPKEA